MLLNSVSVYASVVFATLYHSISAFCVAIILFLLPFCFTLFQYTYILLFCAFCACRLRARFARLKNTLSLYIFTFLDFPCCKTIFYPSTCFSVFGTYKRKTDGIEPLCMERNPSKQKKYFDNLSHLNLNECNADCDYPLTKCLPLGVGQCAGIALGTELS